MYVPSWPEDSLFIQLHRKFGNSWEDIAQFMPRLTYTDAERRSRRGKAKILSNRFLAMQNIASTAIRRHENGDVSLLNGMSLLVSTLYNRNGCNDTLFLFVC